MQQVRQSPTSMVILIFIAVAILGRLLPHPPNVSPLTSLALLAGLTFTRKSSWMLLGVSLLLSDILLGYVYHFPIFGSWTFFTYSGFFAISLFAGKLPNAFSLKRGFISIFAASFFYWTWTNFGVFLFASLYPMSAEGLVQCYIAALPFLQNSLLGDGFWWLFISGGYYFIFVKPHHHGLLYQKTMK